MDTVKYFDEVNISQYNWIIPTGWKYQENISDGVTEFSTNIPEITVTPDACTSGNIKVRGINTECSGKESTVSDSLFVYRSWPSYNITGPNKICNLGSESYFISGLPSNVNINWTHSSNIDCISPEGSNPCYFTKNGSDGSGYINAELSINECTVQSTTIRKDIWLGVPTPDKIIYYNVGPYYPGGNSICLDFPNDGKALFENSNAEIVEYEWDALDWTIVQHPNDPFSEIDMENVQITAPPFGYYVGDPIYFTIRARNQCGWSNWKYPKLELECISCGYYLMTLFPNPADTYVELSFEPLFSNNLEIDKTLSNDRVINKSNFTEEKNFSSFTIHILDNQGVIRKDVKLKSNKLRIEIKDLEAGTYYIHIITDENTYKQQLIIK